METLHKINPAEVVVPEDRLRKDFDERKIRNLADSFKRYGQISPALCRKDNDDSIILVAGERRLRACKLADMDLLYVLSNEANDTTLREIEFEENYCRENLTWSEEVDAKNELHLYNQQRYGGTEPGKDGGHSIKDTARILGESVGNVAEDLELAQYAEHFEEVAEAKKKTDAKKIVKRIKAELKHREQLAKAIIAEADDEAEANPESDDVDDRLAYFNNRVLLGKLEERLDQFEDGFFDIVIWDPPWQVGLDEVRKKGGGTRDFKDKDDPLFERFQSQLKLLSRKMGNESHLYLFFGIVHYERIYQLLEDASFETNGIPIIWHKQGAHVTRNPLIWPGRSYEPIAYARKGSKDIVRQGSPDLIITPMPTENIKQSHPAGKHPDVMLDLLKRSAEPGNHVLDPMCGSGMTGVAAEVLRNTHKLDWWMIEMEPTFRDLSVINTTRGYSEIVHRAVERPPIPEYIVPPIPDDFRKIEPGTAAWSQFWDENPGQQEEMLVYKREHQK